MRYLMFKEINSGEPFREGFIQKLIIRIVLFIFPKANPDYEDKIDNAFYWLLEFENEEDEYGDIPNKEIGLDENYKPILKMPYKKNYGFWLVTNMTYLDFTERFNAENIDGEHFKEKWDKLE